MKSWAIVRHSVRQVIGNRGAALRISLLLYAVQVVVGLAMDRAMSRTAVGQGPDGADPMAAMQTLAGPGLLSALVALVAYIWIAVAWHRYVLTVEVSPGLVPEFNAARLLGYFGTFLQLMAIFSVAAASFAVLGSTVLAVASPAVANAILPLLPLIVILLFSGPGLRLATVLPGVALEPGHRLAEGWRATAGEGSTLYGVGLIWTVTLLLIRGISLAVIPDVWWIGLLWAIPVQWIEMMVGISLLTTLYGHYIQKRPLI